MSIVRINKNYCIASYLQELYGQKRNKIFIRTKQSKNRNFHLHSFNEEKERRMKDFETLIILRKLINCMDEWVFTCSQAVLFCLTWWYKSNNTCNCFRSLPSHASNKKKKKKTVELTWLINNHHEREFLNQFWTILN